MKSFLNYYHYRVWIRNRKIILLERKNKKGKMVRIKSFEKPVTENKLLKIYIIKNGIDVVYVGITSQSIRNRFRYGLRARGKGGYHGYKFKNLNKINLIIFCFNKDNIGRIEAIEAEIVYLVRNRTGNWPKHQTEIHFHKATKEEKRIAHLIYKTVK